MDIKQPDAPPGPSATARPGGGRHQLRFHGEGGTLFGLLFVNAFLTVVTLGIYYFWGATRMRKFVMSNTELDGDRFAFHGNGKELFLAAARLIGIVVVAGLCIGILGRVFGPDSGVFLLVRSMSQIGLFCLIPFAMVGSRRYMLNRTSWKGIRFVFKGTGQEFFPIYMKGLLLTAVTLGIYGPFFLNTIFGYLINNSYYGTRRFSYTGRADELFWLCLKGGLLTMVTMGIYGFWFQADQRRFFLSNTRVGDVQFESTMDGGGLFGLAFVNMFLTMVSFGIAVPWVIVRTLKFNYEHTVLNGNIDVSDIKQEIQRGGAMGQELAGLLDVDAGIGFGM